MLWKATKTPTIKIHVEVVKNISNVVESSKSLEIKAFLYIKLGNII